MINDDILKIKTFLLRIRTDHKHQYENLVKNKYELRYEFIINNQLCMLGLKGVNNFEEIIKILLNHPTIGKNFSNKTLRNEVQKLISIIVKSDPKGIDKLCKEYTDKFIQELENAKFSEWEVIIPIVNLTLGIPKLEIGNVMFTTSNYIDFNKFRQITSSSGSSEDIKSYINRDLISRFENKTIAIVKIYAKDSTHAQELGLEKIEQTISILRFYSRGTQRNDTLFYRMFIDVEGLAFQGQIQSIYYNTSSFEINQKYKMFYQKTGYLYEYEINEDILKEMNDLSLDIINRILMKKNDNLTEFERILLKAVDFFGKGMHLVDPRQTFLSFITSLEILLTNTYEPQKGIIAERIALLIGETAEQRMDLFEKKEKLQLICQIKRISNLLF